MTIFLSAADFVWLGFFSNPVHQCWFLNLLNWLLWFSVGGGLVIVAMVMVVVWLCGGDLIGFGLKSGLRVWFGSFWVVYVIGSAWIY
jgi:hypothetical protein